MTSVVQFVRAMCDPESSPSGPKSTLSGPESTPSGPEFRRTALKFARDWRLAVSKDPLYWDQSAFNDLLRGGKEVPNVKLKGGLFVASRHRLKVGILPVSGRKPLKI